jgi:hypothetical protein
MHFETLASIFEVKNINFKTLTLKYFNTRNAEAYHSPLATCGEWLCLLIFLNMYILNKNIMFSDFNSQFFVTNIEHSDVRWSRKLCFAIYISSKLCQTDNYPDPTNVANNQNHLKRLWRTKIYSWTSLG